MATAPIRASVSGPGVQPSSTATAAPSRPEVSAGVPFVSPGVVITSVGDPKAAAQREADRLLTTFVPPPGATELSGRPDPVPGDLKGPPQTQGTSELVTSIGWYATSASPSDVLAWVDAHPPTGSGGKGGGSGSSGPSFAAYRYEQPAYSPAILQDRVLLITPSKGADGRTVIRLDAQVVWVPARPAAEQIPGDATAVTVVAANGMNHVTLPAPVTVTDPAVVKRIADLSAALPVLGDAQMNCAADDGTTVTLTFRAAPTGPAVAELVADPGGCGEVTVRVGGRTMPKLWGAQAGFVAQVYAALGVTWDPRLP